MGRAFDSEQRKVTEIAGIEAGYRYVDSPVAWNEPGDGPDPDNRAYVPTTWPGFRLPHVWLDDRTPIQDRLGFGYTLLQLGPNPADTSAFERELRATGAPLDVLRLDDAAAREIYARDLILVRPGSARRLARQRAAGRSARGRGDRYRPRAVRPRRRGVAPRKSARR